MAWGKMDGGRLLLEIAKSESAAMFMARMKRIAEALILRRKGVDEWADEMLADGDAAQNRWSEAGKASGEARKKRALTSAKANKNEQPANKNEQPTNKTNNGEQPANNANDVPNNARTTDEQKTNKNEQQPRARANTDRPTEKEITKKDTNPTDHARTPARALDGSTDADSVSESGLNKPDSASEPNPELLGQIRKGFALAGPGVKEFLSDPTEGVWCVTGSSLPECAAAYFEDASPGLAVAGYRKELRRIGESTFRRELDRFIHEERAGEMENVRNRGAAFMARLRSVGGEP